MRPTGWCDQLHLTPGARRACRWSPRPLPPGARGDHAPHRALNAWVLQTRESRRAARRRPSRWAARLLRMAAQPTPPPTPAHDWTAGRAGSPPTRCAVRAGRQRHAGAVARLPAGLCLWLGREHDAGRHQGRAAGPERGPAHLVALAQPKSLRCRRPRPGIARRRPARPFSPMLAILSSQHEAQYSRLFARSPVDCT